MVGPGRVEIFFDDSVTELLPIDGTTYDETERYAWDSCRHRSGRDKFNGEGLERSMVDLTVVILDRERHQEIIND